MRESARKRRRLKKKYRITLVFILLIIISGVVINSILSDTPNDELPQTAHPRDLDIQVDDIPDDTEPEISSALILAAGDVMVHTPQLSQAMNSQTGEYDFSPSFEYITPYVQKADIATANLETTLAGQERGFDGYPLFNTPDILAYNLKETGFDIMCTANNHSLDSWESGLYRTIETLKEAAIEPFGTARTPEERQTPLIVNANDINVAFLAYTDSTNGLPIPTGKDYIINYLNLDTDPELTNAGKIFSDDIKRAREAGADIVAVYMHWGYEYQLNPNDWQKRLARILAEQGADLILGSHPHVIQPMEYLDVTTADGSSHRAFAAYSMGNFVSNQYYIPGSIPTEEVKYGLALFITLEKEMSSGKAGIKDVEYMITWVNRDWRHRIIPVHDILQATPEEYNIPPQKYDRIRPVWEKIKERLDNFEPAYTID